MRNSTKALHSEHEHGDHISQYRSNRSIEQPPGVYLCAQLMLRNPWRSESEYRRHKASSPQTHASRGWSLMGPVEYGSAEERDRERARGERALMVCKRLGSKREGLRAFLGPRRTSSTGHYSKCSKAYVFHCTTSEWSLFEMLQVPGHCSRDWLEMLQARLVTIRNAPSAWSLFPRRTSSTGHYSKCAHCFQMSFHFFVF